MWARWVLLSGAAAALTVTGQSAAVTAAFPCVAAFLHHYGWSSVNVMIHGNVTGSEARDLMVFLSRRGIFISGLQQPLAAAGAAATGADTLLLTRSPQLTLTDRWRRRHHRVLVLCLGCSADGFFLRTRFAGIYTASLSANTGGVRFYDSKMWNRPRDELPVGTCLARVFRRHRRPYDDFSVWSRGALAGVTLRVAAVAYPRESAQLLHSNGSVTGGVAGELLLALQRTLGFSYRLETVDSDQPWSALTDSVSGGTADMTGALMIGTPRRHRRLKLGQPVQQQRVGLALRRPAARSGRGAVLRPFTAGAWAGVAAMLTALAAALLASQPVGQRRTGDVLFAVIGLMTQQGTELPAAGAPARLALISGLAGAFVLYTTYAAVLLSFLAVNVPQLPFGSVAEFHAAGDWRYASLHTALAELSPLAGAAEPVSLAPTYPEAMRVFAESEKMLVDASVDTMIKYLGCTTDSLEPCPFCVLPGATARVYRSLAFRRDFPHTDLFDSLLLRMRGSGALQRLIASQEKARLEDFMCPGAEDVQQADLRAMDISDLRQLFCLLTLGGGISLVLLVIERCVKQEQDGPIITQRTAQTCCGCRCK